MNSLRQAHAYISGSHPEFISGSTPPLKGGGLKGVMAGGCLTHIQK
ncbi:MAG: hypothetical protein AB8B73_00525 [Ekhidna sp.]